ncbi:hypothetical protein BCT47_15055 [Vibrio splendidus]|uniref:hypothetical protein n=1 Tax=Vibrio splendidus TaxID=29497 RepID=UPI000C850EA8|nr:hypothetical protein [Vibrio splendidus]PMM77120.1 hypothetical protein BCT47_15055 [Vibrio splendidus]
MTLPITLIDRSSYKSLTKKNRLQRKIVYKEKIADKAKITHQEKLQADRNCKQIEIAGKEKG